MTPDGDDDEFQQALAGGWSLSRPCALALALLRNAGKRHEKGDRREGLSHLLALNVYSSESETEAAARQLLQESGLVLGDRIENLSGEGWRAIERLKRLDIPSGVVPASRELLLHALYAAGRSGMVLRDAYWGVKQRKKYDEYSEPWFEPWLIFAGEVISLERFEEALGFLDRTGLARSSRRGDEITDQGRALVEASSRTMRPGYLQEALSPPHPVDHGVEVPRRAAGDQGAAAHAPVGSEDRSTNRVTYVIHGNVSNLVGNTGDSTVTIVNAVDVAAVLAATEQLRALLPTLQMNASDSAESTEIIAQISAETAASSPDRGRLHRAMHKLKELVARTQAPLTDIAVGVINEQLRRMTG